MSGEEARGGAAPGNPTEIRDWRDPAEWPIGAKPVTRKIAYDDLYRVNQIQYEYSANDASWISPYARENGEIFSSANFDHRRNMPSPYVSFDKRVLEQDISYDWLGNTSSTDDDAHGFYDRSLGTITNNTAKPYQLASATNASKGGNRTGSLNAKYDVAGNLTDMAVNRTLTGTATCLPSGSGCNQTFHYQWDEVGRLVRAQRWDVATPPQNLGSIPSGTPPADLTYTYDASDNRVLKSATAKELNNVDVQRHSVYISGGQELRGAKFAPDYLDSGATGADYQIDSKTEIAYLFAHGVRLGRVAYDNGTGMPAYTANAFLPAQHVLINLDDTLGSTSIVIDRATSELVEASSYLAHGATESDYRPDRWNGLREDYRFAGKEEDVEVGLQYFGKRFLSPYLNRWVSADPLAVHEPGKADSNLYAYVHGQILAATDPVGLDETTQMSLPEEDPGAAVTHDETSSSTAAPAVSTAGKANPSPAPSDQTGENGLHGKAPTNAFEAGLAGVYNSGVSLAAGTVRVLGGWPDVSVANTESGPQLSLHYGNPDVAAWADQFERENSVASPGSTAPAEQQFAYRYFNIAPELALTLAPTTGVTGLLADSEGSTVSAAELTKAANAAPKRGIYEFPDQTGGGTPYVGQSGNIPKRLGQHEAAGRLTPGTETTTAVEGGKTAREVAEHSRIQELTGGIPARQSNAVTNKVDPIGPNRQHLLKK